MPSQGGTGGPAWGRDRVVVVVGGLVALIAIGIFGALSPRPASTAAGPALALSDLDDVRDAVGRQVVAEAAEVDAGDLGIVGRRSQPWCG